MPHPLLQQLTEHLASLEEQLLRLSPSDVNSAPDLLAPDFVEFGASGSVYTREEILRHLSSTRPRPYSITDLECTPLGPDAALLRYRVAQHGSIPAHRSLHSSTWVRRDGRWQILFHQGTPG